MLRYRVISALVGVPILIALLFLGKLPFFALVLGLTLVALGEFFSMVRHQGRHPIAILGLVGGAAICIGALLKEEAGFGIAIVFILMIALVLNYSGIKGGNLSDLAVTVFGSLYIGLLFSHLILIRGMNEHGPILVLLVFIATWIYDIVAYIAGSTIGRRKLAPKISPGKTWEGALFAAFACTAVLAALVFIPWFSWSNRVLLGLAIGIVAPLGDLAESKLKREAGIKDTSSRIPGHGGILDRFDSLLFTAPVSYYLLKILF